MTTAASISTAPVSMLTFGSASLVERPGQRGRRLRARPDHVPRHAVAAARVRGPVALGAAQCRRRACSSASCSPSRTSSRRCRTPCTSGRASPCGWCSCWASWRSWRRSSRSRGGPAAACWRTSATAAAGRRSLRRRRRSSRRRLLLAPRAGAAAGQADAHVPGRRRGRGRAAAGARRPDGAHRRRAGAARRRSARATASRRIDLLVLSHGHADHVGGLEDVVGGMPITTARDAGPADSLAGARRPGAPHDGRGHRRAPRDHPAVGRRRRLVAAHPADQAARRRGGQPERERLRPGRARRPGRPRALVPGDAEGEVLQEFDLPQCDVVELPHHGSRGGLDRLPDRRAAAAARRRLGGDQHVRSPDAGDARPPRRRRDPVRCAPTSAATSPSGWTAAGSRRRAPAVGSRCDRWLRRRERRRPDGGAPAAGGRGRAAEARSDLLAAEGPGGGEQEHDRQRERGDQRLCQRRVAAFEERRRWRPAGRRGCGRGAEGSRSWRRAPRTPPGRRLRPRPGGPARPRGTP